MRDLSPQTNSVDTNITESKLAQESMRRSREQLRQLAIHVDKVKEQERAHIAREIHDDLGGTLLATKIDLACIRSRLPQEREDLLEKAKVKSQQRPPLPALLTSAEYSTVVTEGRTRITGTLTIDVLDDGLHALPLELAGVGIRSALLDGQPASIGRAEQSGPKTRSIAG